MTIVDLSKTLPPGSEIGAELNEMFSTLTTGSTIILGPHVYDLETLVTVPSQHNIIADSGGLSATSGTVLRCTAAGAGLKFDDSGGPWSRGGLSGGFVIDGNDTVTAAPLRVERAVQRTFLNIHVRDTLGDAVSVYRAQNNLFMGVDVSTSAGNGIVIDGGAGGNQFLRCEVTTVADYHLVIQETLATAGGNYAVPTHNAFDHCIFERGPDGPTSFTGCASIEEGIETTFRSCVFSSSGFGHTDALIHVQGSSAEVLLDNCYLHGNSAGTGIKQTAGGIFVASKLRMNGLATGWDYTAGYGSVNGPITYASVTSEWGGSGSVASRPNARFDQPVLSTVDSSAGFGFRTTQRGDSGFRWQVAPSGQIGWADGTTYTAQQTLGISSGKFLFSGGAVTGVTVDAASIHAALVTLGLITT